MKRQHIEEEEEVLRQITEASDAIRRKYPMIKTGLADADRVYADILKPVVTPLKALVEKEKPIELKKDLEIQDLEIKEEKNSVKEDRCASRGPSGSAQEGLGYGVGYSRIGRSTHVG